MRFYGQKRKSFFIEQISKFIPENIDIYIEPFGGTFCMSTFLKNKPNILIYNDINDYNLDIKADFIYHLDYKDIFDIYNTENVVWYLDPPYYKKEFLYDNCEKYTKDFHIELKNEIEKLKGKIIISYEDNIFIRDLYKDFNIHKYKGNNHIFNRELIITR